MSVLWSFVKSNNFLKLRLILVILVFATVGSLAFMYRHVRADSLPVISVFGTIFTDTTWYEGNVYFANNVIVPDGVTLTLELGVVVKTGSIALTVQDGGTLNATGTALNPVVFTSWYDDAHGGDSNGDGSATTPEAGDYTIAMAIDSGATTNISYTEFKFGAQSLSAGGGPTTQLSVTDSVLNGMTWLGNFSADEYTFVRNTIIASPPNQGHAHGISLNTIDPSGIILVGSDANTLVGSGPARVVDGYNIVIPTGNSWTVDDSVVLRSNNFTVA